MRRVYTLFFCLAVITFVLVVPPLRTQASGALFVAYSLIQDEAVNLTRRTTLNFTGTGVACVDSASPPRTDCTITATSSLAFSAITSGTNTGAAMVVGTGASFGFNQTGGTQPTLPANTVLPVVATSARTLTGSIANPAFFTSARWNGTIGALTAVQSGDQLGGYNSYAYDGATIIGPLATFRAFANQNHSVGAGGTYAEVATTPNGSTTVAGVMRWEANGGVTVPSTVTGGNQGAGTLNATALYQAGVRVTSCALTGSTQLLYDSATGTCALSPLFREDANTVAQRNGTTAQSFNVYNTYTSAANNEYLYLGWAGGVGFVGTFKTGPGTQRAFRVDGSSISLAAASTVQWTVSSTQLLAGAGQQISIPQGTLSGSSTPAYTHTATWSNVATTFVDDFRNITDTNSAGGSLLAQWQVGGSDRFKVDKLGAVTAASSGVFGNSLQMGASGVFSASGRSAMFTGTNGNWTISNNAGTDFGLLQFGGTTSSFPALKRSTTGIIAELADDTAGGFFQASSFRGAAKLFANLATVFPTNGDSGYCSDCTVTSGVDNTCAGSGTGSWVYRLNGVYKCVQ